MSFHRLLAACVFFGLALAGCERDGEPVLPDPQAAARRYAPTAEGRIVGNVLTVSIPIADEIIERGGPIWVRGGPYFYLFSIPTRDLLVEYPDLAAVRVETTSEGGTEIARALLRRDTFTEARWQDALTRSAIAQRDGTARPRAIEELVMWGERHTDYEYNPEFLPAPR
jgi:hypothetical protein